MVYVKVKVSTLCHVMMHNEAHDEGANEVVER